MAQPAGPRVQRKEDLGNRGRRVQGQQQGQNPWPWAACLLLPLTLLSSVCLPRASAYGSVVELHREVYFGDAGGQTQWVVPDPRTNSEGAPLGCTNLPTDFYFQSSRLWWNTTAGVAQCHFIWFFFGLDCQGGARGVQVPPLDPGQDQSLWVSQDPELSRTNYWRISEGKSIGCSFDPDPCVAWPCEDPKALCQSSAGWEFYDDAGLAWAQQMRSCTQCQEGYLLHEGWCTSQEELCKSLSCKEPAVCGLDAEKGVSCQCPADAVLEEATGTCRSASDNLWLSALNQVRTQATGGANAVNSKSSFVPVALSKSAVQGPQPLQWADNLASVAHNWTDYLNSTQCGKGDDAVMTKIPDSPYSESDVWVSWSGNETAAVDLWAPDPADRNNPRTARIVDDNTQYVGCGKTRCRDGAFFTCLFYPKTL